MGGLFVSMGTGPGIGLSTAKAFADAGYDLLLTARNRSRLEDMRSRLQQSVTGAVAIEELDCGDPEAVAALVDRHGVDIDVLHYNAAVVRAERLEVQALHTINTDLHVNIGGALAAIRTLAPQLVKRGKGTILLTGGVLATQPSADLLSLSVGKAGLRAVAQALFPDLAAHGVHIATLTIGKAIAPDSEDADAIARSFLDLHSQPTAKWSWEAEYPG